MIQKETLLKVADNSGAKLLNCFHLVGSTGKRFAHVGDRIKCSVKSAIPTGMVKKGEVVDAVIVRTKKEYRRADGTYIRFSENAAVILKKGENEILGSRIFGPVAREVRAKGYPEIVSLAPDVV